MALHPAFPASPCAPLVPDQRWFPADEALRATAYEKLLPPLVAAIRKEVFAWRASGYAGASPTSRALLTHWFDTEHLLESADHTLVGFSSTGAGECRCERKCECDPSTRERPAICDMGADINAAATCR